jgi:hypothetical protein
MIVSRDSGTLDVSGTDYSPARLARATLGRKNQSDKKMNTSKIRIVAFAIAPLLALAAGVAAPVTKPVVKDQPMPFRAGETLNYRVSWAAFSNAASVELSVPERRALFTWQTWHFRAVAHTLSPVATLFPVDDQFDSYTDSASLESRQFESHLQEFGKTTDEVQHLVPTGQQSKAPAPIVVVLPGTRDALGELYTLRSVQWEHVPELRINVYDGHDIFEMRAKRDAASEPVTVPAGAFTASRISISVFQHEKEVSAIHIGVWLANDPARTPVVIQATLPFGTLRGELIPAPK